MIASVVTTFSRRERTPSTLGCRALEAMPVIDGIFSADVVVEGFGRISVGLNQKCILYKIRRVK